MSDYYKLVISNSLFSCGRMFIGGFIIASLMAQNISLSVISIAKAAQLLATVIFTVQAAKLSLRFGNKFCVVWGCIFAILYFMFLIHPSNINVLCAEICNGVSLAFYCGSYEAWLFSCSKSRDEDSSYKAFALSQELSYLSMAFAGLLGALLSEYALLMSIMTIFIGTLIALTCVEDIKHIPNKKSNKGILFANKYTFALFAILSVSYGLMQTIYQFWQPYFREIDSTLSFSYLGLLFFTFMIFQSVCSKLLRKYFEMTNRQVFAQLLLCSLILFLLSEKIIINVYCVSLIFVLFMGLVAASLNYLFSLINILINENEQSMYISYIEAFSRFVGFIILVTYSYFSFLSISLLWSILAINLLFIAIFILMKRKEVFIYNA